MRISDWSSDVCSSDLSIVRRKLRKFIGRGCEGQASDRADFPGHVLIKIIWRIKAGSYRRAALRQGMQPGLHVPQALNACFNLGRVARKFLAQRERCRVLQMGAADFDDIVPALRLPHKEIVHAGKRGEQVAVQRTRGGNVHRCGKAVVSRLALIEDRKSVVKGKSEAVRVDLGG